jgi:hypothetical protein
LTNRLHEHGRTNDVAPVFASAIRQRNTKDYVARRIVYGTNAPVTALLGELRS